MINMLHKAIKGYEDYLVTDTGLVYSLKSRKYLTPRYRKDGYIRYKLYKNGERKYILAHRLVAQAFIDNPDNKPEVDHINRDRKDNRAINLQWVTRSENNKNMDHLTARRKANGTPIVEKINGEVSIGYLSLRAVPDVDKSSLTHHIDKGKSHFYCKGREFYTAPKPN